MIEKRVMVIFLYERKSFIARAEKNNGAPSALLVIDYLFVFIYLPWWQFIPSSQRLRFYLSNTNAKIIYLDRLKFQQYGSVSDWQRIAVRVDSQTWQNPMRDQVLSLVFAQNITVRICTNVQEFKKGRALLLHPDLCCSNAPLKQISHTEHLGQ